MVNVTSLGRIILATGTSSISLKGRPRGEWDFVRENNIGYMYIIYQSERTSTW